MRTRLRYSAILAGAAALSALALSVPASAQTEWEDTVAAAAGQNLNIVIQPDAAFGRVVEVFQERFPDINVTYTNANPSDFAPRMITEQRNGLYAWDVWWSSASNMNNVALPADALADISEFLILPEVVDEENWQSPAHLYTSAEQPYVFVHVHYLQNLGYYNTDLVPNGTIDSIEAMLDPELVGQIALRAPNRPHGGTMMLAQGMLLGGEEWLNALFNDMEPIIVDNARQVTDGVIRGDYAIGIGTDASALFECKDAGGCENIELLPFAFMHSRAVSVFKNPPNPEAAAVFINWLLSKEGQDVYVTEWAKDNREGAFSMRKDVEPHPNHLDTLPDFSNLDQYVAVSLDSGSAALERVSALFEESQAQ